MSITNAIFEAKNGEQVLGRLIVEGITVREDIPTILEEVREVKGYPQDVQWVEV